jgi:surface carbohydrate biosynthesis protein
MHIYFHIDELARDAVVASALKKYFNDRGGFLYYGNRIDSCALRKSNPFDALIFPSVDLVNSYLLSGETNKALIFILPTESISGSEDTCSRLKIHLFGSEFVVSQDPSSINRIDKFFLWGEGHHRTMAEASPENIHKFVKIGHPRHDKLCLGGDSVKNIDSQIQVGLVARFDLINIFDNRTNLEQIYSGRTTGTPDEYWHEDGLNIEDRYYTNVQDLRVFFEIIERLSAENYKINLRVHPRENYDNWRKLIEIFNLNVTLSSRWEPFAHWIKSQEFIMAPPSTSFYDCAVLGKAAISIGEICQSRKGHQFRNSDDFDPIFEYFPKPRSIDELLELVSMRGVAKLNLSTQLKDLLRLEVGFPESENSLASLCDTVLGSLKANDLLIATKNRKFSIFFFFRFVYRVKYQFKFVLNPASYQSALFNLWRSKVRLIDDLTG